MTVSLVDRVGLGVGLDQTTADGSVALGTIPVKVTLATSANGLGGSFIGCWIVNPNATAVIAYRVVPRNSPAPTFDATFSATGGSWVLPGRDRRIVIPVTSDLYVVASAASSSWGVSSDIYS